MKSKLKMCWLILISKEYIVSTEKRTELNCSGELAANAMFSISKILFIEKMKIENKMDSAIDEVNQILKGKV